MIKAIKSIWQNLHRPKVYVDVSVDHVELAEGYLLLGLNLEWHNQTAEPIMVQEARLRLFEKGRKKEPIKFDFQGHFARIPGQRVIKKSVGEKSFRVPAGKSHQECIRFFTRDLLNLEEGNYPVEIHAVVPEGTYVHQAHVQITPRIKYRTSEAWIPEVSLDLSRSLA